MNRNGITVAVAPPDASTVLLRAAEAFKAGELTWGKEYFTADGDNRCRCTMGAIAYAIDPGNADGDPTQIGAMRSPERALALRCLRAVDEELADRLAVPDWEFVDIGQWNDSDAASVDEVVEVLEAAAARAQRAVA